MSVRRVREIKFDIQQGLSGELGVVKLFTKDFFQKYVMKVSSEIA